MLTRTAARRSAVVLTLALIAMLLVALSGSARAASGRTNAGTGHSSAGPNAGRQAAAVPPAPHDQHPWHLDLASTAPSDAEPPREGHGVPVEHRVTAVVGGDEVAPTGRAPPAV